MCENHGPLGPSHRYLMWNMLLIPRGPSQPLQRGLLSSKDGFYVDVRKPAPPLLLFDLLQPFIPRPDLILLGVRWAKKLMGLKGCILPFWDSIVQIGIRVLEMLWLVEIRCGGGGGWTSVCAFPFTLCIQLRKLWKIWDEWTWTSAKDIILNGAIPPTGCSELLALREAVYNLHKRTCSFSR